MKKIQIEASTLAMFIDGILYGDDSGFEEVLEQGYDVLEIFFSTLKESDKAFTILIIEDN